MAKINGMKFLGDHRADMIKNMMLSGETVPGMQIQAAYLPTMLEHACALKINSHTYEQQMTSVCCRMGPSSNDVKVLCQMLDLGMSLALLGVNHGPPEDHLPTIEALREACRTVDKLQKEFPLGIAIMTRGMLIHTGVLEEDADNVLEEGATVKLTCDEEWFDKCWSEKIYIEYPNLLKDLAVGDEVLINYKDIRLTVQEIGAEDVTCKVEVGGSLQSSCVVNLPRTAILSRTSSELSDRDKSIIDFAIAQNLDVLFVSGVRSSVNITEVKDFIGSRSDNMRVVGCIEDVEGFNNVDDILTAADGILIDRGNLSIALRQEKLFIAQKIIIAKCNEARKPVVVSTQVLSSMAQKPRATRPEISDVAYAVLDGADGIVLTKTTSVGKYPLEALKTCIAICKEAEASIWQMEAFSDLDTKAWPPTDPITAIAIATVEASMQLGAHAILVASSAPTAALAIASFRPRCAVIAVTRFPSVARKLQLTRSVFPLIYSAPQQPDWRRDVDARFQFAIEYGMTRSIIGKGSSVVLVSGWQHGKACTNTIRIVVVARKTP